MTAARADVAADLRRRRGASARLAPLEDGRRDTLDPKPRRRKIQTRAIGGRSVEFIGADRAVYGAIKTLGTRYYQRSPRGGSWLVRDEDAEDVMALLEARGYTVEVVF